MVSASLLNAARGLSEFMGRPITMGTIHARVVRFGEIYVGVGDPESEMVGVYLRMKGDLSGQAMLILPLVSALNVADVLMEASFQDAEGLMEARFWVLPDLVAQFQ